jgi:hypothetical protein
MKKSLLALSLTALLFSCKKDITQKSITAQEIVGTGYVKGQLTKQIIVSNTTNGANPFTSGNGWSNARVPAAGVNVTVRVAKSGNNGLYPNSQVQGTDVYTGTTDANGNFNIAVKSNGANQGVNAQILVEAFQGTMDSTYNGSTKTGRLCNYFGWSTNAQVYVGQSTYVNGPFGANTTWIFGNNMLNAVDPANPNTNSTPFILGTAVISGTAQINVPTSTKTGTAAPATITVSTISNTNIPAPAGLKVYCTFNNDPSTLGTKVYQTTTDAVGGYTFNIATLASGNPFWGPNQNYTVWFADFSGTRDTLKLYNNTVTTVSLSTSTGLAGAWLVSGYTATGNGLWNNEIRNATNFNFNGYFQAN